ncbi:hypothetical protein [Rickettsiales endosymbiont of Trichoplax sp. H2]|uniref:hypothetical protein n=1 Tax=Rickettsiales endosymbiont of Trichoplax sp. H2 TaxID=2021221 RepID=UPI0012B37741|nr:hypothetical protein [Rickettsiales endosymbiont of Trichoplax sp. H2]MSO14393.1 hypothetical protein [Rickettsiales endosymbiont of Trichoplax sp. H2]
MNKKAISRKINSLEKKKKEIAKKILELKNKEDKKEKEVEVKKKMIIGDYFLNKYKKENKLNELQDLLDKYLTKKRERRIFNLN